MTDQTVIETPAKTKRRRTRHTAPRPKDAKPAEFEGLTEFECCNACAADKGKMLAAQQRLNEIELMHPRQPSRNPRSQTVMEGDQEYLARNPQIADEFRKMTVQLSGGCYISGKNTCAHPFKGGLQPEIATPEAVERFERAKKVLRNRKIDLTKTGG